MQTKEWHSWERQMGHDVNKTDIYDHYHDLVEMTCKLMREKQIREGDKMPENEVEFIKDLEEAFNGLKKHSQKAASQFADRLLQKMNARILLPSRYTALSLQEEKKDARSHGNNSMIVSGSALSVQKMSLKIGLPIQHHGRCTRKKHNCFSQIKYPSG